MGGLTGALVSWGIPKDQAIKYEAQVKAGKFLLIVRGTPEKIEKAKALLASGQTEGIEVYEEVSA